MQAGTRSLPAFQRETEGGKKRARKRERETFPKQGPRRLRRASPEGKQVLASTVLRAGLFPHRLLNPSRGTILLLLRAPFLSPRHPTVRPAQPFPAQPPAQPSLLPAQLVCSRGAPCIEPREEVFLALQRQRCRGLSSTRGVGSPPAFSIPACRSTITDRRLVIHRDPFLRPPFHPARRRDPVRRRMHVVTRGVRRSEPPWRLERCERVVEHGGGCFLRGGVCTLHGGVCQCQRRDGAGSVAEKRRWRRVCHRWSLQGRLLTKGQCASLRGRHGCSKGGVRLLLLLLWAGRRH
ncbi:hypothetical protein T484DRAFT_2530663 [Baffinella frigidus]|nr:hypothetical protein T484DRAFT_2530663 [Cryptophyta sp. CCMP2293]